MNYSELVTQVAQSTGMAKEGVKKIVEAFTEALRDAAVKGEDVVIPGFGQFKVKNTPARTGRNPSTGESMEIGASRKLAYVPAKAIKDAMKA